MKKAYPAIGITTLCGWFGLSRQAYYQHYRRRERTQLHMDMVLREIHQIRRRHPRMGGRKLYQSLAPFLQEHQIKLGRDALFDLLATHSLLVKRRKRNSKTTNSHHLYRKYANLIKEFRPTGPNQLWVSDITYWRTQRGFLYISFVSDAYSRRIMGYHVSTNLAAEGCKKALRMALSHLREHSLKPAFLIHHSDRGIQYCSDQYTNLLKGHQIQISMTEKGDPLENPIAERINGIIKEEYLDDVQVKSLAHARRLLKEKVNLYNQERPHMSISNLTPEKVHITQMKVDRRWKNYFKGSLNNQDKEEPKDYITLN